MNFGQLPKSLEWNLTFQIGSDPDLFNTAGSATLLRMHGRVDPKRNPVQDAIFRHATILDEPEIFAYFFIDRDIPL